MRLSDHRIILPAILLLAAVLRFNHVNQPLVDVFSWRQASTAMMADNYYRTSWNIFFPEVSWTGPGPNYQGREFQTFSYLTALLYKVFGQHEAIGRALSAAFGTWGVFALYALVRRVWDTPRALATALMLAILPGAIFIDRSFLPDPAMLALTSTAMWLFVRALQTGRRGHLVVACAVSSLAFLTKLPGVVALAPMIYAAVCTVRRAAQPDRRRRTFELSFAFVLAFVPVAAYYAWAVYLGSSYPPYHVAGASNWLWKDGLMYWLRRDYFLPEALKDLTEWLWTAPVIGLVLVGCVVAPPRAPDGEIAGATPRPDLRWFFHLWLAGCGVLYLLGARELTENPWNLHVLNLFAAAMAGHALAMIVSVSASPPPPAGGPAEPPNPIEEVLRRLPAGSLRVAGVIAVVVAFGQYRLGNMYSSHATDSYKLGVALEKRSAPGDLVVTMADDVGDPIAVYYSHRRGWVFPPAHMQDVWAPWNLVPKDPKVSIAMLEDLRGRGAKWLGIVSSPKDDTPGRTNFWKDHPEVVKHIGKTCEYLGKTRSYVLYRFLTPAELPAMSRDNVPATQPAAKR